MTFLLPLDALIYTVPVLTAIMAEFSDIPWFHKFAWYYACFIIGCFVVYLVRRLWR